MNVNKGLIILIIISIFLTGCDTSQYKNYNDFNQVQKTQISLNEYMNKNLTFYYRQVLSSKNICINGTCPENNNIRTFLNVNNCGDICQNGAFKEDEDKIDLNIASLNNNEMYSGCSNKDTFFFPDKLKIVEERKDYIKAKGKGYGTNLKIGDNCNENFEYKYETEEVWIFTDKKLEDLTKIDFYLNDEKIIDSNKKIDLNLESNNKPYIDIICENSFDLNMKPYLEIAKINGKKIKDI